MMDAKQMVQLLRECHLIEDSDLRKMSPAGEQSLTKEFVKEQVADILNNAKPKRAAMIFEDFLKMIQRISDQILMPLGELVEHILWIRGRWHVPPWLEEEAKKVFDTVTAHSGGFCRLNDFTHLLHIVAEDTKGFVEDGRSPFEVDLTQSSRIFEQSHHHVVASKAHHYQGEAAAKEHAGLSFGQFKYAILQVSYHAEFHPRFIYIALQKNAERMGRHITKIQAGARGMLSRKKMGGGEKRQKSGEK